MSWSIPTGITFGVCIAMALFLTPVQATGWPTHDWHVVCHGDQDDLDAAPGECDPGNQTTVADFLGETLQQAGRWLESLGYRPPAMQRGADPEGEQTLAHGEWVAYLYSDHATCHLDFCEDDIDGVFFSYPDSFEHLAGLHVAAPSIQDIPGETPASPGTVVHELFHAVQHNYPAFASRTENDDAIADWIVESSATYVENVWLRLNGWNLSRRTRSFSEPLHEPADPLGKYGTWPLWSYAGLQVDDELFGVGMFDDLFYHDLSSNGLAGVDEGFQAMGLPGLTDIYLDMVGDMVRMGGQNEWFDECTRHNVEPEASGLESAMSLPPVASRCQAVSVEGYADRDAWVRIGLEADLSDLHLFDGDDWVEAAEIILPVAAGEHIERDLLVANAAAQTAQSISRLAHLEICLAESRDDAASGNCRIEPPCEWTLQAHGETYHGDRIALVFIDHESGGAQVILLRGHDQSFRVHTDDGQGSDASYAVHTVPARFDFYSDDLTPPRSQLSLEWTRDSLRNGLPPGVNIRGSGSGAVKVTFGGRFHPPVYKVGLRSPDMLDDKVRKQWFADAEAEDLFHYFDRQASMLECGGDARQYFEKNDYPTWPDHQVPLNGFERFIEEDPGVVLGASKSSFMDWQVAERDKR